MHAHATCSYNDECCCCSCRCNVDTSKWTHHVHHDTVCASQAYIGLKHQQATPVEIVYDMK